MVNGEKEKAEGSGGEEEVDEEPSHFYDKTKSFFDNISCEATERAKRWVTERVIFLGGGEGLAGQLGAKYYHFYQLENQTLSAGYTAIIISLHTPVPPVPKSSLRNSNLGLFFRGEGWVFLVSLN